MRQKEKKKYSYYTNTYQKAIFPKWLLGKSPQEVSVINITVPSPVHPGYRLEFVSDADIYNFYSSMYCIALVLKQGQTVWYMMFI